MRRAFQHRQCRKSLQIVKESVYVAASGPYLLVKAKVQTESLKLVIHSGITRARCQHKQKFQQNWKTFTTKGTDCFSAQVQIGLFVFKISRAIIHLIYASVSAGQGNGRLLSFLKKVQPSRDHLMRWSSFLWWLINYYIFVLTRRFRWSSRAIFQSPYLPCVKPKFEISWQFSSVTFL